VQSSTIFIEKILQPIQNRFKKEVSIIDTGDMSMDFKIPTVPTKWVGDWINDNLEYDQIILKDWNEVTDRRLMITDKDLMSGWVHCSYSLKNNRKQYLMSYKEDGKTKYQDVIYKGDR
tara:strand:- start:120 stop:473 length:354 start_codon:yes stop_codon:yes gene_type:complete